MVDWDFWEFISQPASLLAHLKTSYYLSMNTLIASTQVLTNSALFLSITAFIAGVPHYVLQFRDSDQAKQLKYEVIIEVSPENPVTGLLKHFPRKTSENSVAMRGPVEGGD